jgi:hypothetical protein
MPIGKIAFLGSGETSRAGGSVFERLARDLPVPLRIAILETPAGFEPNSAQVAGRVADFMASRLQNEMPEIEVIPARKRGTQFTPDDPGILQPLLWANFIFMGPGSPTYAIRQLKGSLAWDLVRARHRLGATLAFASSATIAVGAWGLPVYEVYKVGEDIHSVAGLNLFGDFGVQLSFIPHWNNAEGGEDVDTSRCFVGMERFGIWCNGLPAENTTIGLDEHTWMTIDIEANSCEVGGVSSVSLVRNCESRIYPAGARFALTELGHVKVPTAVEKGIPASVWEMVNSVAAPSSHEPPPEVLALAERRRRARAMKDWPEADRLRNETAERGWLIEDTPSGQKLNKA